MSPMPIYKYANIVNPQEDRKASDHSHPFCPNSEKYLA